MDCQSKEVGQNLSASHKMLMAGAAILGCISYLLLIVSTYHVLVWRGYSSDTALWRSGGIGLSIAVIIYICLRYGQSKIQAATDNSDHDLS